MTGQEETVYSGGGIGDWDGGAGKDAEKKNKEKKNKGKIEQRENITKEKRKGNCERNGQLQGEE